MKNYIKKICPVCNNEFFILHGKDGSSNKLYCSAKCREEARRRKDKEYHRKLKEKQVTKRHVRDWKPLEADIWYHPAEPQKPSGKEPKICCNIAALPKPYLE